LKTKLSKLRADDCVEPAISRVYETAQIYRGPYLDAAPDLIAGFNEGYRASWDAAIGKITARVIEENPKAWCGDHGVDPALVPGVLLSSRRSTLKIPALRIAPTALQLFGVPPPAWMDGKPLFVTA
jgi:predicted AlkP superfamily phosphohydrolase/phosphomutase